jgi:hypothetical protein
MPQQQAMCRCANAVISFVDGAIIWPEQFLICVLMALLWTNWHERNQTALYNQVSQEMDKPPAPGANQQERMKYLEQQIDSMMGKVICGGLVMKEGSSNRLQGGGFDQLLLLHACMQPYLMRGASNKKYMHQYCRIVSRTCGCEAVNETHL